MLSQLRLLLAYHAQAAVGSLKYLCRQPFATAMTIIVIAMTLTLPALLWIINDNVSQVIQNWKNSGHISLYLDIQLSSSDIQSLRDQIRQMPGVEQVSVKTPEDGLKELQNQEGMQDLMLNLPENPLPTVLDVLPTMSMTTPMQLDDLFAQLKGLPGIEEARLDMQWLSRLYALMNLATQLAHGLMVLLAIAVVFIISNTLRLVIHKRHEEIRVLKLIGASDRYIIRPFLYAGLWYGFFGALLAVLLAFFFMLSLSAVVNQLVEVYQMHVSVFGLSIVQALFLILVATFLGWFGARFSVKRQLVWIEP